MKHVDPRQLGHAPPPRRAVWREQLRAAIEARIEMWIEMLDALDGEPDLEPSGDERDDDAGEQPELDRADDEPSLGSFGSCGAIYASQTRWSSGGSDEREQEDEHGTDLDSGELDEAEQEGDGDCDHEPDGRADDAEVLARFRTPDVREARSRALQDLKEHRYRRRSEPFVLHYLSSGTPVVGTASF